MKQKRNCATLITLVLLSVLPALVQNPPEMTTPDKVTTKYFGKLEFDDSWPSKGMVDKIYYQLLYLWAFEVFLHWMPAALIEAMCLDQAELGVAEILSG